jgi:hypothetical protein
MHPVLRHLIETDFTDLAGSRIEGQIAVTDALINAGLADLVGQLTRPASPTNSAPASPPNPSPEEATTTVPDPKVLLQRVKIEHLRYRTEAGRTILEVKGNL